MAERRSNAAIAEMSEMTPEDTAALEEDKAAPVREPEPEPEAEPEAAPEPKAKAEPKQEADPDVDPKTGRQRKVDYGAFHEERERRKAETAARIKAQEDFAKLSGRLEVLQQLAQVAQEQQAPQVQVPDVNENPVGHFEAQLKLRDQKIQQFEQMLQRQQQEREQQNQQLAQYAQQMEQQRQQQEAVTQIRNIAMQQEAEFAQKAPDYAEAAAHVQKTRLAQLKRLGVQNPEGQLQIEALNMAAQALQRGENPAEVIYGMAQDTGWTPKKAAPAVIAPNAQKLATVSKGQAANTSLSQVAGSAPAEISAQKLLAMSDEEFAEATKGGKWAKLMS